MEPGMSVSLVAREAGITASQLFGWRKAYTAGSLVAVGANEPVVPASELQEAMKRIKQLEAALVIPPELRGLRSRVMRPWPTAVLA